MPYLGPQSGAQARALPEAALAAAQAVVTATADASTAGEPKQPAAVKELQDLQAAEKRVGELTEESRKLDAAKAKLQIDWDNATAWLNRARVVYEDAVKAAGQQPDPMQTQDAWAASRQATAPVQRPEAVSLPSSPTTSPAPLFAENPPVGRADGADCRHEQAHRQ